MSLTKSQGLVLVSKEICRELRRISTPAERLFWERVRNRQFLGLKFYRQHPIFVDKNGRETFFVADFYCHERRLVVEIDGKIHNYRKDHDELRTEIINQHALHVVRLANKEIETDVDVTLKKLAKLITETRL